MYNLYFVVFSNNAYFGKSESQLSKVEKEKERERNVCKIAKTSVKSYFQNVSEIKSICKYLRRRLMWKDQSESIKFHRLYTKEHIEWERSK